MTGVPNIAILCAHARPIGVRYFDRKRRRPDPSTAVGDGRRRLGRPKLPDIGAFGRPGWLNTYGLVGFRLTVPSDSLTSVQRSFFEKMCSASGV
jgi:hypothetical protein